MKLNVKCQMLNVKSKSLGFTLVEILITIVILVVIFSFGLFISFDFYRSYASHSEKNIIVSVLQKARNQSLSNINQTRHGVYFSDPLTYTIFECPSLTPQCTSYTADPSTDVTINPSYGVSVTGTPFEVVFDQLNGSCVTTNCLTTPLSITINADGKTQVITVNSEGRIDW